MRWLTFLGLRYGIAFALALVIAGFVVTLKFVAPESSTTVQTSSGEYRDTPNVVHEHIHEGDDLAPTRAPVEPSTSPGAVPPEVVAKTFTQAWVRHTGVSGQEWLTGLSPY